MEGPSEAALGTHGYTCLSCIGRGSQGAVYTVRSARDNGVYVLKRVHIMEPEARRAALREAETLQRLQHPAIVGYRDTFVDDEHLCIVMEYADGGDLASRIAAARDRPFGEEQILQWLVQLALALHHVHERGVLHRDLKTQNVFLTSGGALIKLGDFGVARGLCGTEPIAATCVGTPYYMAPELFKGEQYGTKADIWALGCVLYELVTRRRAFQSPNLNSLSVKVRVCRRMSSPPLLSTHVPLGSPNTWPCTRAHPFLRTPPPPHLFLLMPSPQPPFAALPAPGQVMRGDYGPLPPTYSSGLHELVRSMLTVHSTARPSVAVLLAHPLLRRHVASFADAMLAGHSDAAQLATPALASLRSQLACCGLSTAGPRLNLVPSPAQHASQQHSSQQHSSQAHASQAHASQQHSSQAHAVGVHGLTVGGGVEAEADGGRYDEGGGGRDERRARAEARVEDAMRKLEEERRWRQRERRACRALPINGGNGGHAPSGEGCPSKAAAGAAAGAGAPNAGGVSGGAVATDEGGWQSARGGADPGSGGAGSDWNGEAFRMSRAALHGRRAALRSSSAANEPPPPPVATAVGLDATHDAHALHAPPFGGTAHAFGATRASAHDEPLVAPEGRGHTRSLSGEGGVCAMDVAYGGADGYGVGVSDENWLPPAPASANTEHGSAGAGESNLMGISAKDRVLARREMRRRAAEERREDDLKTARQRYFQERVLANNAQRSQYLGSYLQPTHAERACARA